MAVDLALIGTLQLFAEAEVLKTVAPAIDSQYTPNLSAYTTAFAYNVAAAQAAAVGALLATCFAAAAVRWPSTSSAAETWSSEPSSGLRSG